MPPGTSSPYADGRKAFATGAAFETCPHPAETKRRYEWEWGWRQAAADADGPSDGIMTAKNVLALAAKELACRGSSPIRNKSRWT